MYKAKIMFVFKYLYPFMQVYLKQLSIFHRVIFNQNLINLRERSSTIVKIERKSKANNLWNMYLQYFFMHIMISSDTLSDAKVTIDTRYHITLSEKVCK